MSRRTPIAEHILKAANQFDSQLFCKSIKGSFADFPDHKFNTARVVYPTWYLFLIILTGYFSGCNTIEDIAEYALHKLFFASEGIQNPTTLFGGFW